MNRLVMGLAVGVLWLAGATAARADSQPITGTAQIGYTDAREFSFSGPTLSAFSSAPDGPEGIASCIPGDICEVGGGSGVFVDDSFLTYQGNIAPYFVGTIGLIGAIVTPSADQSNDSALWENIPVTLSGEFTAYTSSSPYGPYTIPLYTVSISGSGTVDVSGSYSATYNEYLLSEFYYTYCGIADVTTPEPSSLLLLASGLLGLLILSCRRFFAPAQHPACD